MPLKVDVVEFRFNVIHRTAVRLRVESVREPVRAHASVALMHAALASAAASTIHNGS